jgi:hypothetical protein
MAQKISEINVTPIILISDWSHLNLCCEQSGSEYARIKAHFSDMQRRPVSVEIMFFWSKAKAVRYLTTYHL